MGAWVIGGQERWGTGAYMARGRGQGLDRVEWAGLVSGSGPPSM